ncbi:hypothetical protein KIPB_010567, partial [Kipferlia bialata]
KRIDDGSLVLDSASVHFKIDKDGKPLEVHADVHIPANAMIEEFMLLANQAVAAQIQDKFPSFALLRRHPPPPRDSFARLQALLEPYGCTLDTSSNKALADSLRLIKKTQGARFGKTLAILCTRCLSLAKYFPSGAFSYEDYGHFGLAMPIYTHFTSPIRRYADLLVHRQLSASIGLNPLASELSTLETMCLVTDNLNSRK